MELSTAGSGISMKSITVRQDLWLMGKARQLPGAPGGARTDPLSVYYFSNHAS